MLKHSKCPEVLCPITGVTLIERSVISLHLRRHYPSLIATTTSCANPKLSYHFLLASYMIGLYWLVPSQFEIGPSPRYL